MEACQEPQPDPDVQSQELQSGSDEREPGTVETASSKLTVELEHDHGMHAPQLRSSVGPRQANLVLIAYASSEGSGEPAHPRSLARTSAARSYKQ